jgi:hypothetical protein
MPVAKSSKENVQANHTMNRKKSEHGIHLKRLGEVVHTCFSNLSIILSTSIIIIIQSQYNETM